MAQTEKPVVGGHKQQRQMVRKIVWNSNRNLPIKAKIDDNRGSAVSCAISYASNTISNAPHP